jgi:ABC-type transporter Mla MlaB component
LAYLRPVSALGPGDHACLLYDDERRRDEVLRVYLGAGVSSGDQVLYAPDGDPGAFASDLSSTADARQVRIAPAEETYLPDGVFDPDRMLAMLRDAVRESRACGFRGLRTAGEPPRALTRNGSFRTLVEYERRVNDVVAECEMTGVCLYDTRTADPGELLALVAAHPIVVYAVRPNPRLRVQEGEPGRLALTGQLELATISGLVPSLMDALGAGSDVEVDLADVTFVDLAGLRLLLEAGAILDERGHRLVIVGGPEWMEPILKMLDYDSPKGLVLQ